MLKTLRAAVLATLLLSASAHAEEFARCLLKQLPSTDNDVRANAVLQLCLKANPAGWLSVEQGSGRAWFSFKSGAECTVEKASGTSSHRAALLIASACRKLYDEPVRSEIDDFLNAAEAQRR